MSVSARIALVALVIAACVASLDQKTRGADLPENVFAVVPGDDVQDVVFLADTRPLFLRLHIRVGGVGFRTAWLDFIGRLHRYLDGDGDGVVTVQEGLRGNWQQMIQALPQFVRADGGAGARATLLDSDPMDGQVSVAELARYVRTTIRYDALGIQPGLAPDPRAEALFAQLDLDHNGVLECAELAALAVDRCLARLDLNEDELIDLPELKPFENANANQVLVATGRVTPGFANLVVLLGNGAPAAPVINRLLGEYDRAERTGGARNGRLSAAELGCPEETLRRFDADGDGTLDSVELSGLLDEPVPDVELNVELGEPGSGANGSRIGLAGTPRYSVMPSPGSATEASSVVLGIEREGAAVVLAVDDNIVPGNPVLIRQFDMADRDQNGYVDRSESNNPAVALVQRVFTIADRNGDGKLFKLELEAYVDRQSDAIASRIMLTVTDRGRTLFELLDSNGDQQLGLRELRRARQLVPALDCDGDGRIAPDEIPRRYSLGIGRGPTAARRPIVVDGSSAQGVAPTRRGSTWFERMDRNGDGDVSPREFLGSRAQFQRFDRDGDGLIDSREAGGQP
jgi:Ca2+-binding EF-hand superfamily protein